MSKPDQLTQEQIEKVAEQCAADPQAYTAFVLNLTAPPESYNMSQEVVGGLVEALRRLAPASLELDHYKRAMTYGEKLRINPPFNYYGLAAEIRAAQASVAEGYPLTDSQSKRLLLIHGILGKLTEAMEQVPILLSLLTDNKDFDRINLLEELGDDRFYTALVQHAASFEQGDVEIRNVLKLGKRYKGGTFTAGEAVNRDLDSERRALEDDLSGDDLTPAEEN